MAASTCVDWLVARVVRLGLVEGADPVDREHWPRPPRAVRRVRLQLLAQELWARAETLGRAAALLADLVDLEDAAAGEAAGSAAETREPTAEEMPGLMREQ